MKNSLKFVIATICAAALTSCQKEKNSNFDSRIIFDAKPQVKDVLKGKSSSEVLKMKYKSLLATCTLETQKNTKGQFYSESTGTTPTPPTTDNPVSNPKENSLTYDLKLQQLVDRDLTKDVTTKLASAKDGQVFNVELTFKPVNFQEALNVDSNKKKYFLKHTPVLTYTIDYQLHQTNTSTVVGKAQGKILEKVAGQRSEVIALEIGIDKYSFVLDCDIQRTINHENDALAAEFDNQWIEIDCLAPKSDEDRAVCK